ERPGRVSEYGGKFGCGDGADIGLDLAMARSRKAGAEETDASVSVSGVQGHRDGQPGVNSDAGQHRLIAKRGLLADLHYPSHLRAGPTIGLATHPPKRHTRVAFIRQLGRGLCYSILLQQTSRCTSPDEIPLCRGSLVGLGGSANSRFFTNC